MKHISSLVLSRLFLKLAKHFAVLASLGIVGRTAWGISVEPQAIFLLVVAAAALNLAGRSLSLRISERMKNNASRIPSS